MSYFNQDELDYFQAAMEGDVDKIQELLAAGKIKDGINQRDPHGFGFTALIKATQYGREDLVRFCLEQGADVLAKTEPGYTSLSMSARISNPKIMDLLLKAGARVNDVQGQYDRKPLHIACLETQAWATKRLIEAGAELDPIDEMGRTPLGYAGWMGCMESATALLGAGATSVVHTDKIGLCSIDHARHQAKKEVQAFLEKHAPQEWFVKQVAISARPPSLSPRRPAPTPTPSLGLRV